MATVASLAAILKKLFCTPSEPKGQLTQNLVESMGATYRSKIVKLFKLEI